MIIQTGLRCNYSLTCIELRKQMRMLAAALTDGDKRPTVTTKDPADKVKGPYNDRSDNNIGL
jgi:hypothetical protein